MILLLPNQVQDTTRNEDFDELEHSSSLVFTPEFANVVNVDGLRIKDGKVLKWQVLHTQDGNNSEGNCCLFSANGTPDYIQTQSLKQSRTIPFKVIGCIKEKLYPEVL